MTTLLEDQIEALTKKLVKHCKGENSGVVIGAAFNIAQTALNTVSDYRVLQAVAATLRSQAHMIDLMAGGVKH